MELKVDFPRLSDNADPDIKKIRKCLVILTEQLKFVLSNLDEGNFSGRLASAVGGAVSVKEDVSGLREAIIKTASVIKKTEERLTSVMKSEYAAISDIGEYTENAIASYEVNGKGIEQYFDLITNVAGEVDDLSGYIKTGILDGGEIGVEIGDVTCVDGSPFKVRLTGQRLSFYSGSDEVAYMSDSTLYVTKAYVTGKFTLGNYEIDPTDGLVIKYIGN
ncbi:MAG: hypothetical protein IKN38_10620 [Clostridia bacterium]|nr:hypothetical protein [Clostridia bacterium]